MTDPGNQENPHGENTSKPNSGKGTFGWYKPPESLAKPLAEPDSISDNSLLDIVPTSDEETLFRAAAIKCAQMEENLSGLLQEQPYHLRVTKDPYYLDAPSSQGVIVRRKGSDYFIISQAEELSTQNPYIRFGYSRKGYGLKNIGIDSHCDFFIQMHTDRSTMDAVEEARKKNPDSSREGTRYYFDKHGAHRKEIYVRNNVDVKLDPFHKLVQKDEYTNTYETEMTAGDFELAGQALQMLINRLKPQDKK